MARCKVCKSPYTEMYEKLYDEEDYTQDQVLSRAKEMGDDFSQGSFSRHIRNHYEPEKEEEKEKSLAKRLGAKEAEEEIDKVKEIKENLRVARSLSTQLIGELDNSETMKSSKINALRNLLSEIRQTIGLASELSSSIDTTNQVEPEDLLEIFISIINKLDIPEDEREKLPIVVKEEVDERYRKSFGKK